jgi:phage repressor protein C with HTH and peptisase S24 domain
MGREEDAPFMEKLYKYVKGKVKNPRGTMMADLAAAVGMTEPELRFGRSVTEKNSGVVNIDHHSRSNARIGDPIDGFARVPLRGLAMGGKDGALVFSTSDDMGDVLAPPILFNVPNAYAVYVVGDSMLERFKDGWVVYVHPHRRVVKGDDCVIQLETREGGDRTGFIKEFVSRDDKFLKVRQLNPVKLIKFRNDQVVSVHKIVMSGPAG